MEQVKRFSEEFFKNLKCDVVWSYAPKGVPPAQMASADADKVGKILEVRNVPKSFEDILGRASPYRLSFSGGGLDFVGKGSQMMMAMSKYLEGAGKTTLLRIDFEVNPEIEIRKRVGLKNCEIESLEKKHKNSFFSRFSFVTSFNYLNESERVLSEIYVHEGKIVEGDLSGYSVVDGEGLEVSSESVKRDYMIAKEKSIELAKIKQGEVSGALKERVELEVSRVREHYDKALNELGGDLNGKLEKIKEVELELRSCSDQGREGLRKRLEKLRGGLVKVGDDEAVRRVLKDRDMTIKDVMHKYSLNVDRKLVNTTVIYYPVYSFKLHLKLEDKDSAGRLFDVGYDPLTRNFSGLDCESCYKGLNRLNLCGGGHVCCDECLDRCGECGGVFCTKCLKRGCGSCGRKLCKSCIRMCLGCGRSVCITHLRRDCVSGEDRCVSCLRACLRCNGMSEEKYFGEAMDGSKVCGKCLGSEKSGRVLERVFRR